MKNKLFTCFTGTSLTLIINGIAYTQSPTSIEKLDPQSSLEKIIPISKELDSAKGSGFIFRNDINNKAVRNFIKDYKDASDVKWIQSDDGAVVFFTMNGIKSKVSYHKNGDYERMIRYYYEDKLPREIRHLVKSNYYDFSICCITEVNNNAQTIYEVKIEDKTCWKTVRIADNEMVVAEEYSKR